jgi:hypothetical protein
MLARIFGVYAFIVTVAAFVNRKHMIHAFKGIMKNEGLLLAIASVELLAATYLITIHNVWSGWPMLLTIIFWLAFFEGAFYHFFPEAIRKFRKLLKKESYYYFVTVVSLLVSLFLLYQGFWA